MTKIKAVPGLFELLRIGDPLPPSGYSPNKLGKMVVFQSFPNLLGKCPKGDGGLFSYTIALPCRDGDGWSKLLKFVMILTNCPKDISHKQRLAYMAELDVAVQSADTGPNYSGVDIFNWMRSWGKPNELPPPKCEGLPRLSNAVVAG